MRRWRLQHLPHTARTKRSDNFVVAESCAGVHAAKASRWAWRLPRMPYKELLPLINSGSIPIC
jgi:hypothetical protein